MLSYTCNYNKFWLLVRYHPSQVSEASFCLAARCHSVLLFRWCGTSTNTHSRRTKGGCFLCAREYPQPTDKSRSHFCYRPRPTPKFQIEYVFFFFHIILCLFVSAEAWRHDPSGKYLPLLGAYSSVAWHRYYMLCLKQINIGNGYGSFCLAIYSSLAQAAALSITTRTHTREKEKRRRRKKKTN